MQSPINSIIREVTRRPIEPLNILTGTAHEAYQTAMAYTNHNFYAVPGQHIKKWNPKFRPMPHNYHELPTQNIPNYINFDLCLSHHKFGQYQVLSQLAKRLGIGMCSIEHTLPMEWHTEHLEEFKKMNANVEVFISDYSADKWGYKKGEYTCIHHGIETDLFKPKELPNKQPHILSINNDFIGRGQILGFPLFQELTKGLPTHLVGETSGLSVPAKDIFELVDFYQQATFLLNTTTQSPIPCVVLEAMSCGIPVISTDNCLLPEVIEHSVNGFLSNNPKELRYYCELLLSKPELAVEMGKNARQTILSKFSLSRFVDDWDSVFYKVIGR